MYNATLDKSQGQRSNFAWICAGLCGWRGNLKAVELYGLKDPKRLVSILITYYSVTNYPQHLVD